MAHEPQQGVDLNGDGDTDDFDVIHLVAIDWGTDSDDSPPRVSNVTAMTRRGAATSGPLRGTSHRGG